MVLSFIYLTILIGDLRVRCMEQVFLHEKQNICLFCHMSKLGVG
jgi:hypothetical protein